MLSRRLFGNCLLCAGMGLVATDASAQTPAAPGAAQGLTRTILSKVEMPAATYDTLQVMVGIEPGFLVARHTHPGTESSFVIEGGGTLFVQGRPDRTIAAGDAFLIPPEVPHALQNKGAPARLFVTYTVERGKPIATPAPE
jgi:quercetin dioxygenase-like cupin family protein